MTRFSASMDAFVRGRTLGVSLLFFLLPISRLIGSGGSLSWSFLPFGIMFIVLAYSYLQHPKAYQLDARHFSIVRGLGAVAFPLHQIQSLHRIHHDVLDKQSGGAFGFIGNMETMLLGTVSCYTSRKDNLVMITLTDNRQILVSPDEPERFITMLEERLKATD